MPNWKKLIVSGSDAHLSSLDVSGALTASSAYFTSASIGHLQTIYETASVIYSSGSTKFGDTPDDTHEITGSLLVNGSITGDLTGTSSYAITASHALNVPDTASHALTSVTASFALTASHLIGNTGNSGSFSGSFEGDGSKLTGFTIAQSTLVEDTFTDQLSVTSSHAFDSKNVNVVVYNSNDEQILPSIIKTLDNNNIGVDFSTLTSGRIVITKGGHIISGSIPSTYREDLTDNTTTYIVSHSLNEDYPIVQVWEEATKAVVLPSNIISNNSNTVTLTFAENFNGKVIVKK